MKINKAFLKENKNLLIRMLVMSLIGAVAIFADIWLKIDSKVLNELIVLLFSTVTVIAGLWISCYLLFLQLYKDRYPIKVLKECYLPNMRYNFAVVVFCIVYGSVVIVINNGVIANLYYSAVCVTTILEIMIKMFYTLINKLNDVLLSTEQRQKKLQEELIDIYIAFIYKTRSLVNQQYLEILFQLFERVIKEMDEKRKISSNLGDYIISSISGVAQNGNKESRVVVIKAIDLLYSFLNEDEHMNFVITSSDKKQRLYSNMICPCLSAKLLRTSFIMAISDFHASRVVVRASP